MKMKSFLFIVFMVSVSLASIDAQRLIKGTVTEAETKEPLIGATVVVVGNETIGTITDLDGNFSLDVPSDAKQLQVTYVGYNKMIADISGNTVNFALTTGVMIDEVVVVGYGTMKTKEVTSAVTNVNAEDFNKGNINNATQLLQGKVAGLSIAKPGGDPNAGFNIRLRGISTFGSNTQPLLVVDGIIVDNFDAIDPNDVESFSVLKDASAAAIYGTRASNGVLLIKTKSGTKDVTKVEYSGQVSYDQMSNHPDVLTAAEYKSLSRAIDLGSETDWYKAITRDALTHSHGLSFSSGNENSNYRISANYRNGEGVALRSGYEQYGGRLNYSQDAFNKKLNLEFMLNTTLRNEENPIYDAFGLATVYNPTAPVKTDEPEWAEWGGYFQRSAFNFYNPVAVMEQNIRDAKKINTQWKTKLAYKLMKDLTYSLSYSQTLRDELYNEYFSKKAYWSPRAVGDHKGYAGKYTNNYDKKLFETMLDYGLNFNGFETKLLGGYSYQQEFYEEFGMSAGGFLTDGFSYNNIKAATDFSNGLARINSYKNERKLIGFFGRLTGNYKDLVFATANFRREGSTMFGENNKWGNFYGISGGLDVTKLVDIPFVDKLKLRAGYGITGNLPPNPYLSQSLFVPQSSYFSEGKFVPAYGPDRNFNPDLKWETKNDLNVGFDMNMLDYKMSLSADYYKTDITDLMLEFNVSVPPNPYDKKWLNLGQLQTSGIDLALGIKEIALGKKIKWNTDLTFSKYFDSKIVKITSEEVLAESERIIAGLGAPNLIGINVIKFGEGLPVGQIIGPVFDKIDENGIMTYKDLDNDGVFNEKLDVEVLGNGLPSYQLGFSNSFVFGKLDLNFFFRGVFGHSLVNVNNAKFGAPNAIAIQSGMGQVLDFATAVNGPSFSDVHVEDASFVKLDNASLGYTFDLKNKYFKTLRLFITGQNLVTFTGYSGVDPEVRYADGGDGPLAPGIDRENTYVTTRGYTFGINFNF